jgi:Family of unknown function (DUF5681)
MSQKERDGPPSSHAKPVSYEVGYGRPPRGGQFKLGQSGNPKGRPSEATIWQTRLNEKIEVREGGRLRRITVREAIVLRCIEEALKGNIKTANFVLNRSAAAEAGEVQEFDELSKDDREVLKAYERQITAKLEEKG